LLLERLVTLAGTLIELFLQVSSGGVCGRFASLGLNGAPPAGRLFVFTASLHVGRLRRFATMPNSKQISPLAPWQEMSALGQKQTCALQQAMSALPLKAPAKADIHASIDLAVDKQTAKQHP
jgi:hypothetical protein